ncbi:MAG: hypothetical protein HQL98_02410 [Magnetococcales bacterium]|nr:hypothetical protein [Magnetococcales bacterium]
MKITADGFDFDFTDAIDVFVFDEKDKTKPGYHDAQMMKAVDLIVELQECYLFVEMKDIFDTDRYTQSQERNPCPRDPCQCPQESSPFKRLKELLKYKFRDTYLFRHAEQKVDKPIRYICLLTFENAFNLHMQKTLQQELPVGRVSRRWQLGFAESCAVVHVAAWNRLFPKWPVRHA